MDNKKDKKSSHFICKKCSYETTRKSQYDRHLLTSKHKKNENGNILESNGNENQQKTSNSKYTCQKCDKEFNNRSGLWKHSKKCNYDENEQINSINNPEVKILTNMVLEVVKQNNETQKQNQDLINKLYEICKNGTHNTNHTNSHNKSFNMQFFLNETCKDAMNITDFVNSLQLQITDLINVGESGYIEGISNIIVKNLNALDVTARPIHCMDKKRETMYIKDEDKWEKDDVNKGKESCQQKY
jgi:hypothetical protein